MIKADLNRKISEIIAQKEAPGAAISMIKEGQVIFDGCYGFRDLKRRLPVTCETIFESSSLTKAFTATALLIASEEGRVDLARPINAQKQLLILNDEKATREISLIDVLSHTTGMAANDMLWYLADEKPIDLMRSIRHLELIPDAFKKNFNYCNTMYAAVANLFDQIVGKNWESYLAEKILTKLEMNATSFRPHQNEKDVALPYVSGKLAKRINVSNIAGAAAIRSNLSDLSRWVAFLLNPKGILSKTSVDNMFSPHAKTVAVNPLFLQGLEWLGETFDYGLGWFIGSVKGKRAIFHMGLIDGFSTVIVLIPELQVGCIALVNDNLSGLPGVLIQEMINHEL